MKQPLPWGALATLVALAVGIRTVVALQGYFHLDDFVLRYRAASESWSLGFAFAPYNGRLSPVGYSLDWILQVAFPGSHLAVVLVSGLLLGLTVAFTSVLMFEFTARLQAMVLAGVIVGLSLFTFEVGVWWCATMYALTMLACSSLALWLLVRCLRWGKAWWPVALAFLGAALSDSKGFLSVVLLFGLAAGIAINSDGPLGVRGAWHRLRPLWLVSAAVSIGMLVLSILSSAGPPGEPTVGRAVRMFSDLWVLNIAPAVLGGPWWWYPVPDASWPPVRVLPAPPVLVGLLCLGVCGLGLILILKHRPAVSRFVPWALLYSFATSAIPVIGRSGTGVASPAYRYTYDTVLPVAVLLCLGLVPMWWQVGRGRWHSLAVAMGLSISMALSTTLPAFYWGGNKAKDYMQRAATTFGEIPPGQTVIPHRVPEGLLPGLLYWQYANTNVVMASQPGSPIFSQSTRGTLYGFSPDGSVELQEVDGPQSLPGPDPDCGYRITTSPVAIPLSGELIEWPFLARVAYFSGSDVTLNLAVGGEVHTVDLLATRLDAVYFPVSGPGEEVLVSVGTPGTVVCVTEVRIGNRVSAASGRVVPLELTSPPEIEP